MFDDLTERQIEVRNRISQQRKSGSTDPVTASTEEEDPVQGDQNPSDSAEPVS